ncbi:MAG: bifunctional NADP-dependent methylenetetrahydromethanopterin dehydrogenase/methylenetetrahydrofolate dehydrogenase [Planctomycetota bacterium]|nr:MAG: bifunctional NADP-dependent methylenetetrahydromethanopterin dehydrogenase/methylenetetrahydrofolate dehydrogenase [Planctomycetota bacterium]
MALKKILLCLDSDPQPSVFDAVVAADAGVDHLFRHGGVKPEQVRDLIYGAMFTRGPTELKHTAVFIGGSDVTAGEALLRAATEAFFGPVRVSVMLDSNGSNTTAAAAVLAARRHVPLAGAIVAVLAGTGAVGRRVVRLLAKEGARVRVGSRKLVHAEATCDKVSRLIPGADLTAWENDTPIAAATAIDGAQVVIACGPPGAELLARGTLAQAPGLQVAIDVNAVPPPGIADIEATDKAAKRGDVACYGALGVGGTKMKIHKAAIARLFTANNLVLDADEVYALGKEL